MGSVFIGNLTQIFQILYDGDMPNSAKLLTNIQNSWKKQWKVYPFLYLFDFYTPHKPSILIFYVTEI